MASYLDSSNKKREAKTVDEVVLPARHGISRARLFIQLADQCVVADKDMHGGFIDAAILFYRTAMNRLRRRYVKAAMVGMIGVTLSWRTLVSHSSKASVILLFTKRLRK